MLPSTTARSPNYRVPHSRGSHSVPMGQRFSRVASPSGSEGRRSSYRRRAIACCARVECCLVLPAQWQRWRGELAPEAWSGARRVARRSCAGSVEYRRCRPVHARLTVDDGSGNSIVTCEYPPAHPDPILRHEVARHPGCQDRVALGTCCGAAGYARGGDTAPFKFVPGTPLTRAITVRNNCFGHMRWPPSMR